MKSHRTTGIIDTPDSIAQRIDNIGDVNKDVEFDYDVVIVGGGTAGCVLASRLSENPSLRVLMVETGGRRVLFKDVFQKRDLLYLSSSRDEFLSRTPAMFPKLFGSQNDYAFFTEPQPHAANAKKFWPRAKALGGCFMSVRRATMMNGHKRVWRMQRNGAIRHSESKLFLSPLVTKTINAFERYFLKFERYNRHPDHPGVNLDERGRDGPVDVGHFGYCTDATIKSVKACLNLGIPLNHDVNSPSRGTLGVVTKIMTYIDKNKTRVTAESAYLTPDVLQRPNLFIAVYSTATRIIFDIKDGTKRAVGLEFAHRRDSANTLYRVRVKKELILAAGAVHSPHLLMLSGVGAQDEIEKHGIPVIHDLPGVGRALQDHVAVTIALSLKPGHSLQHLLGISFMDKAAESAVFVRSDDTHLFESDNYDIQDETSGTNAPDLELVTIPIGFAGIGLTGLCGNIPYPSMTLGAIGLRPQSRGRITLKSSYPFDAPIIDPHYLEKHNDVAVLVRGIRLMMKIAQTEPLASALERHDHPLFDHDLHKLSDEELEGVVRKRIETLFHPTSTCRMAKLEDEGVVDARLKVHGLDNVRVVDASIFTRIPSGHTTAVVYAVAEKAADMIKQALA